MKKSIFKKLGGLFLGLAMGLGVAAGVMAGSKASEVKAATSTGEISADGGAFSGWDSQLGTKYSDGAAKFDKSGRYVSNTSLFSGSVSSGMTNLEVKVNGKINGTDSASNKFTVYALDSSGTTLTSTNFTGKIGTSYADLTLTISSGLTNCTGIKIEYTKSSGNWGVKKISWTVTYSTGFNVTYTSYKPGDAIGDVQGMPSSVTGVSTHTVSTSLPTVGGYTCDGWSTESGGSKVYNGGETLSAAATLYPHWNKNTYSINDTITNGTLSLTSDNPISFKDDLYAEIIPNSGYRLPTLSGITIIMGENTDITEDAYDPDDGSILYEGVTGNITITATCPVSAQDYGVNYSESTNVTITGASVVYANTSETYTITADENYKLPTSVSVSGATYSYALDENSYNTATLTISNPTTNVSIDIDAIELASYTVSWSGSNYTHKTLESIQEFGEETVILTASEHYDFPEEISVTGADHDFEDGVLTISNPTGAVTITVNPVPREHYTISVLGSGGCASHFSYSGHEAGIYATESVEITLTPDTSSDDIYVISASNISVIGANKGSYTNNVLTISNPTGNVAITVTPVLKVLESIRIETNPNKTSGYKNGDSLDTTGLDVKAVFNTGEETIPTANLTFSQTKLAVTGTAGTAKSETIYVYYHGKSVSFDVSVSPVAAGASTYNKVTSTTDLTNGQYLIVYEGGNVALNGELTSDVASNTVAVTISNNSIASSTSVDAAAVTFDSSNGSFLGSGGKYIGHSGTSNTLNYSNTAYSNTVTIEDGSAVIKNGDYVMRYNNASDQKRFRYYKSGQQAIQLYKYTAGSSGAGVAINASYASGNYTAGETIDLTKLSTTLVYSDGDSDSVTGSISPSTYVEGTAEYTVTYLTYSTVIQIANVAPAKQMTGIELDTSKVQTVFSVGESFNSDGLVVNAVYDNGDREPLAAGTYEVTPPTSMTEGTQTVTVTYSSFEEKTYTITVSAAPAINVSQSSITGYVGESTDITLELINFSGNTSWSVTSQVSSNYEVEPQESDDDKVYIATVKLLVATENDLTLEISELNSGADPVEITIHVNADYLTGIEATTTKNSYVDGDMFDFDLVTVTASYISSGHQDETIDIDDCTVTAVNSRSEEFDLNNPLLIGTYTITVEYGGESDNFNISVSMPDGLKVVVGTEHFGSNTYTLVTSTDSLKAGKNYIIVGIKNSAYYAMEAYLSGNNCRSKAINDTPEDGVIDNAATGLCEFTLGGSKGNWTLKGGSYYLYAAGGTSSNYLKGTDSADNLNAQWTINIATDGKATVVTADNAVTKNTMRFNTNGSNDPLFSCYASGQSDIYFYEVTSGESSFTYDYVDVSSTLYAFIRDTYTCEGGGLSTLSGWDDAFNAELNPSYASLSDDDKAILKNGVVSGEVEGVMRESWDKFAGFITSYDKAVASGCTNYLDRANSSGSRISPLAILDNVDTSVWVISAVALAGLTAIGGYFFYRKRKEN